jgi:hypothetical protein
MSIDDPGLDVAELGEWIDVVQLTSLDQRRCPHVRRRRPSLSKSAFFRLSAIGLLFAHDLRANASRLSRGKTAAHFFGSCASGAPDGVGVEFNAAIIDEARRRQTYQHMIVQDSNSLQLAVVTRRFGSLSKG